MWAQLAGAAIGLAVMAAPGILGYGGMAADTDHTLGPIAVSIGIMAASEVLRALRWGNFGIAVLLLVSCAALDRPGWATLVVLLLALGLGGTALVRGRLTARFGGGWSGMLSKKEA